MSALPSRSLPDSSLWRVNDLRVTLFHAGEEGLADIGTWEKLLNQKPIACQIEPKTGRIVENGAYGDSTLQWIFVSEPFDKRLEWHLRATELLPQSEPSFRELSLQLLHLMEQYVDGLRLSSLERVAYGVNVMYRVPNLEEGYQQISQFTGVDVTYPEFSDFLYQVNRTRLSSVVAGANLNRLMKWSIVTLAKRVVRLDLSQKANVVDAATFAPDDDQVVVNLDLDINTARKADSRIPKGKVGPLLREFDELAREIIANGNIP